MTNRRPGDQFVELTDSLVAVLRRHVIDALWPVYCSNLTKLWSPESDAAPDHRAVGGAGDVAPYVHRPGLPVQVGAVVEPEGRHDGALLSQSMEFEETDADGGGTV